MQPSLPSRRRLLRNAATAMAVTPVLANAQSVQPPENTGPTTSTVADRDRRMKWWREARFGMFIHFGLYSVLGRHEWAMEQEGISVPEYEKLAAQFKPKPNAARE